MLQVVVAMPGIFELALISAFMIVVWAWGLMTCRENRAHGLLVLDDLRWRS